MLIKVKVYPDSNKEEFIKKGEDSFEIWVKAKPVQGQANASVIKKLADFFQIEIGDVKLIRGWKQSNKIFDIKKRNSV